MTPETLARILADVDPNGLDLGILALAPILALIIGLVRGIRNQNRP